MIEEKTTSVKISTIAKNDLDSLAKNKGIGKIEIISRTIQWLAKQDDTLQAIVLNQISNEDDIQILRLILDRKLSKSSNHAPSFDDCFGYLETLSPQARIDTLQAMLDEQTASLESCGENKHTPAKPRKKGSA